jgi:pimeloyl-ACP methyl ester carboxylesterase
VLIGHSLGGLVVQKYLERNAAPGAVLLAPVPPAGTIAAVARLAARYPATFLKANLLLRLEPFIRTPKLVRALFFTPATPRTVVDHCFARLQDESYPAFIDTMIVLARPRRVRSPILVLGAERDAIFTIGEVRRTASAYRTDAEIFTGMGHDMMLDQGWSAVADRIDTWVREQAQASADARVPTRYSTPSSASSIEMPSLSRPSSR